MLQYFDDLPYTVVAVGAGSGIGKAAAELMGAMGASVGCLDQDAETAEDTARAIEAAGGKACSYTMNVTDPASTARALNHVEDILGAISGLVNCAGITGKTAQKGAKVELDDFDQVHNINVRGALIVSQAVLPGMRARRSGHIVNVTSMGGFITMPGISFYCGSKFALEGISEALGKEVAALGIHVTALAPGQFRTDWAGRSMQRTPRAIADYDAVMDPLRAARKEKSGNQPNDPAKAAAALLKLVASDNPPARLLLGEDALALVEQKLDAVREEIAAWEDVTRSTGYAG